MRISQLVAAPCQDYTRPQGEQAGRGQLFAELCSVAFCTLGPPDAEAVGAAAAARELDAADGYVTERAWRGLRGVLSEKLGLALTSSHMKFKPKVTPQWIHAPLRQPEQDMIR